MINRAGSFRGSGGWVGCPRLCHATPCYPPDATTLRYRPARVAWTEDHPGPRVARPPAVAWWDIGLASARARALQDEERIRRVAKIHEERPSTALHWRRGGLGMRAQILRSHPEIDPKTDGIGGKSRTTPPAPGSRPSAEELRASSKTGTLECCRNPWHRRDRTQFHPHVRATMEGIHPPRRARAGPAALPRRRPLASRHRFYPDFLDAETRRPDGIHERLARRCAIDKVSPRRLTEAT
jgi:hypothetical protein